MISLKNPNDGDWVLAEKAGKVEYVQGRNVGLGLTRGETSSYRFF